MTPSRPAVLRPRPHYPTLSRAPGTLQFGAGPGGAVEAVGLEPGLWRLLSGWRGELAVTEAVRRATEDGVPAEQAYAVITELWRAGALVDAAVETRARQARRAARVLVSGDGPLAAPVAAALTDAGVRPIGAAGGDPDLVLLTDRLHPRPVGEQHLAVRVVDGVGLVGPLVLPGRSACLRCVDLHLADRDPCWPVVAADLARRVGSAGPATVAATAGLAAEQALLALDGLVRPGGPPPTLDGTLELDPARGWLRRRSWPPHPGCGCTAPDGGAPGGRPPSGGAPGGRPPSGGAPERVCAE